MISRNGAGTHEFVLVDGLRPADVVRVHREVLRVLRSGIHAAHLDAYSDDDWPASVRRSYECALSLARAEGARGSRSRRADPGMGIEIDVRDDGQFTVLSDLVPYTIHAEGRRRDGRQVFSAGDSGTALWIAVTREQEAVLLSRWALLGIPSAVLTARGSRR